MTAAVLVLLASVANADVGDIGSPEEVWTQWSLEPLFLGVLTTTCSIYGVGVRRLWRSAGRDRGVSSARVVAFYVGLVWLALAVASPLDALGATLFAAHMVQHLVLVAVAAPLVAVGKPFFIAAWAMPTAGRGIVCRALHLRPVRGVISVLRRPIVAVALYAVALWVWHMPALYEAALEDELVHWLEHVSFFGTSVLLWNVLLGRCAPGPRILYLFATATQGAVLGALLTVATAPWYTIHESGARIWGVDLLEDQQIAGLIMWIPGGVVHLVAALASFATWLRISERAVRRRERARYGLLHERRRNDETKNGHALAARTVGLGVRAGP